METTETSENRRRTELLVLRSQAGDHDAMDRLLQSHQDSVFRYLTRMLGNRADAEDALQMTLMQVVRKIRWLRNPSLFRPWIYRVSSRMAYRILRSRQKNHEVSNDGELQSVAVQEHSESPDADLLECIPDWLDRLTANGREVLILHYMNGFTTEQIAEILQIPAGTVKSRVSYALSCIRNHAKQRGTTNES